MRSLVIAATLTLLAFPVGARAHDEESDWAPPPPDPVDEGGVDVSVGISAPGAAVTFDTFQEPLAAQGDWVSVNTYGRVWRPRVAEGWRPYYYGRWEWTNEGWLWVSDEPFGWATYHYGRWTQDPYYGWVWIPGYQWAPAWVTWRYSPEYVGWAPLGPGFSVYVTSYPVVYPWWTFVPCGSFVGYPVYRHAYAPGYVPRIWRETRPAPPRAVAFGHAAPAWGGPARGFVETRIGRPVNPVRVQPVGSPGALRDAPRAGVVPVYRPEFRHGRQGGMPAAAPRAAEPRGWDRRDAPRAAPPAARGGWGTGGGQAAPPAPPRVREGGGRPPQAAPPAQHYAAPPAQRYPAPPPQRYQGAPIPQGGPAAAPAPRFQGGERHGGGASPPVHVQPQAPRAPQPVAPPARSEGGGGRGEHGGRGERR